MRKVGPFRPAMGGRGRVLLLLLGGTRRSAQHAGGRRPSPHGLAALMDLQAGAAICRLRMNFFRAGCVYTIERQGIVPFANGGKKHRIRCVAGAQGGDKCVLEPYSCWR